MPFPLLISALSRARNAAYIQLKKKKYSVKTDLFYPNWKVYNTSYNWSLCFLKDDKCISSGFDGGKY